MKQIYEKLNELFKLNEESNDSSWEAIKDKINLQDQLIDKLRDLAKEKNTLVGRLIKFPMADSYAMYIIVKVNIKTVKLVWLNYSDGWVDDRIGYEGKVSLDYAKKQIKFEDSWS